MADIVKKKWIHDIKEVKEDGTVVLGDQVAPMTFMECVIDANGNTFENKVNNVMAYCDQKLVLKVDETTAVNDGVYYARKNRKWEPITSGGVVEASGVAFTPDGTNIPSTKNTVQKAIDYLAENGGGGTAEVDGTTISKNTDNKLQIKDGGVSAAKLDAELTAEIAGKVDAVTGKGLSSNDYTNEDKNKIAGLPDATALASSLDLKADKASPALTGVPTAPTADAGTNTQQIATTAFVTSAVEAETTARNSAIDAETSARTAADNTLTANLETLATKEANDVNGLQAQITAGVATSGTITMAAVMDGTTDYSAETDVAPSRHAVQSFVNAQDAQLETEIEDLASQVDDLEDDLSELDARVNALNFGKYYGFYTSAASLPAATAGMVVGYAYVGASSPFAVYNFDGATWTNTGSTIANVAVVADNVTIGQNTDGKLYVKDGSITTDKFAAALKSKIENIPQIEIVEEEGEVTEIYSKTEVDTKLSLKQDKLTAGDNITIAADGTISASGGGVSSEVLTQAEYDAKKAAGTLEAGKFYFIKES